MRLAYRLDQEWLEEEMQSDEVLLLQAFRDVVQRESAVDGDRILVAEVAERYNSEYNEGRYPFGVYQVGRRLAGWGFRRCKNREGNKRAVYHDEKLFSMLMAAYLPNKMSEVSKVSGA